MAIGTDFEIQNDRDVRYIGAAHGAAGAGYYTILAFHEWLRGLADDASAAGDDFMDITKPTPSEKAYATIITLINSYNIDAPASEHLYQGSIIQTGGDEIYDGIQVVAAEGCHVEIVQNGSVVTNDFWNTIPSGESTEGLNRDVANGISTRFMLKVRTAGADTDGRRLICQTREWFKTFSEFKVNGTGRGVNVVPLTYASDLNNTTTSATVAGWTGITNLTVGYNGIDVDNNGTDEYYYSEWDRATYTINQFYERMKYLARRGTAETLYGLNGELFRGITQQITVDTLDDTGVIAMSVHVSLQLERATGSFLTDGFVVGEKIRSSGFTNGGNNADKVISAVTALLITVTVTTGMVQEAAGTDERIQGLFDAFEAVSWTGGTGQMFAIDSRIAATKVWIQLLTGVAPTDNQVVTAGTSLATCQVNVTITGRTLSFPFCGVSTGTSIIGAYGFGIEAADLSSSDKVFDLTNTQYQAPNWVTFTVGGLVYPSEDYVLVGPRGYRFAYDTEAGGAFTIGNTLTFTTPAGTAKLADLYDLGTAGLMFIGPMLTGTVPTDNSGIADGAVTALVNGAVSNDADLRQLTLNGLLNGGAVTSVVVNEAIPTDTPTSGTIRIKRTSGKFTRHPYSAWNGATKTFTITSHDFSSDTAPNGSQVFISYIDMAADSATESFQGVYSVDRSLFIRVRNGGTTNPIKTFETTGVNGSAGGSSTAVRTSDV